MNNLSIKKKLTFFTTLAGVSLGAMHIANRVLEYISTADKLINSDEYEYYNWRFGKIAYKKTGEGSPLLLVHNLNVCSSSYEWRNNIAELAKSHTVYTIDLLGCGCSDRPGLTYTNYLYVELITNFIKHIIGEKTDVIVSGESCPFVLMACANDETIINKVIKIIDIIKIVFSDNLFMFVIKNGVANFVASTPRIENGVIVSKQILPFMLNFI